MRPEITLWDYALSNRRLAAIYYWPDGRIEPAAAWRDLALRAA